MIIGLHEQIYFLVAIQQYTYSYVIHNLCGILLEGIGRRMG